jgi:hypothetical protein
MPAAIIIVVLLALGLSASLVAKQRLPAKRKRFVGREGIPLNEIYSTYFAASNLRETDVVELWAKVAEILKLDPQMLRPEDRFKVEFAPVAGYSSAQDELEDLEQYFDSRCREMGINPENEKVETLGDFVRILSQKAVASN